MCLNRLMMKRRIVVVVVVVAVVVVVVGQVFLPARFICMPATSGGECGQD